MVSPGWNLSPNPPSLLPAEGFLWIWFVPSYSIAFLALTGFFSHCWQVLHLSVSTAKLQWNCPFACSFLITNKCPFSPRKMGLVLLWWWHSHIIHLPLVLLFLKMSRNRNEKKNPHLSSQRIAATVSTAVMPFKFQWPFVPLSPVAPPQGCAIPASTRKDTASKSSEKGKKEKRKR